MVNKTLDMVRSKPKSPTCFISYDRTMNSTVSPPIMAKEMVNADNSVAVRKNKRLGRGAVNSGLTCECGVFAAMACGEWPTQRVSGFISIFLFNFKFTIKSSILYYYYEVCVFKLNTRFECLKASF